MKKYILSFLFVLLLSGAAWGQPKHYTDVERDKDCLSRYMDANPKWELGKKVTNWCKENPPPKKLRADDPTAWKLTDSKYGEEPWADSRYRLERNEVTGEYRITWKNSVGQWLDYTHTIIYNESFQHEKYGRESQSWGYKEWYDKLMEFRNVEQKAKDEKQRLDNINKAWRPIK